MTPTRIKPLVPPRARLAASLPIALGALLVGAVALGQPVMSSTPPPPAEEVYYRQVVATIGSGKDVSLQGTTVNGPVMTGRSIRGSACITADLIAAQRIELDHCQSGNVMAGQFATLHHSEVKGHVQAVKYLTLMHSRVSGDAQVSGAATIQQSTIEGTLTVFANSLTVQQATLGSVRLGKTVLSQRAVSVTGGTLSRLGNGRTLLRLTDNDGKVSYGGYTAHSLAQATTLTTPEGYRYRNGRCDTTCGGLATYADYQARFAMAPSVEGPGWDVSPASGTAALPPSSLPNPLSAPVEYLELDQGSEVRGDVVFASGSGRVVLKGGSRVLGAIIGGVLETAP